MELKAATDRRSMAYAARSSDGSRALREQMMALAGIASGVLSAAAHAAKAGELDDLDRRALEQGSFYFSTRAEDVKRGKPSSSVTRMAAMGAASEFAARAKPKVIDDKELEARFYETIAASMTNLVQNPSRKEIAQQLVRLFARVSDDVRAEARSLTYQDIDRARAR
jgi:hypothetical protein